MHSVSVGSSLYITLKLVYSVAKKSLLKSNTDRDDGGNLINVFILFTFKIRDRIRGRKIMIENCKLIMMLENMFRWKCFEEKDYYQIILGYW